ncbi:growth hormone secretagogue receptor type 1-like [Clavelina lepadiformis]|uniref:growth hormone secretagogue receptor type 1-like n=1 Tax=Clavelina lepadiformis TaxID=159417 RepID=UPI00404118C8
MTYDAHSNFSLPMEAGLFLTCSTLIPLALFGFFANAITTFVVIRSSKLRSTFNCLIASLCVSDLISAIISPLNIYRRTWGYYNWEWSDFLCKMFWSIDTWTSYATSVHIFCFAALRFISVQWPIIYRRNKYSRACIYISVMWAVSFVAGFIPSCIWFKARPRPPLPLEKGPSCHLNTKWKDEFNIYTWVVYSIFFYLAMILIIVLSIMTIVKVKLSGKATKEIRQRGNENDRNNARREKKIILQLSLIVSSFLLGYIPRGIFHNTSIPPGPDIYGNWWFEFVTYLLLRISECLDPIFYNLGSRKIRLETTALLKGIWLKVCALKKRIVSSTGHAQNSV